jgi:hypothetical protein
MSKKKAAVLLAGLLTTVAGVLYKCTDESQLFGQPEVTAPAPAADAGTP